MMKLFLSFLLIFQTLSLFKVYANKKVKILEEDNSLKWEKINNKKINKIIWKSYKNDEGYFSDEESNQINSDYNFKNKNDFYSVYEQQTFNKNVLTHIDSFIPLNNFLYQGNSQTTIKWKSSFDGGISGGTGQQNPSFLVDYGITDDSILSFYFAEADDNLYNRIDGVAIPYNWQNFALSYKRKLFDNQKQKLVVSSVSTLEYWRNASGGKNAKSIFNEKDDSVGKEKYVNIVGAFSLPISKEFGKKLTLILVPGITFLPDKLGTKNVGKNSYGNNFYIGTGIVINLSDNLKFLSSITNPLGPGSNYFDSYLKYSNKSIYSFGLNWDLNDKIGILGKISNSYGSTPSTGLLTIPSDNKNLYSANLIFNPYGKDTILDPLSIRDKLMSFGGLTVNNALIQDFGNSQGSLNYDSRGNAFFSYKYSLSNIFQLEFIDIGTFKDTENPKNKNRGLRNLYFDNNNLNFRLGGKLMIFSPQKNNNFWSSIRTSVGRNDNTNQGYVYSELINTVRLNNWLAINISPKYFFSGAESFGIIGISKYINLADNLQIIPEMNSLLKQESEFNNTLSFRYLYGTDKSIDLYYSNAIGIQDLGQNLRGEDKFGIKINFAY